MEIKKGSVVQFVLYTLVGLSSTVVQYLSYVVVLWATNNYYLERI